jgi:hypothetical protein
MTGNVHIEVPLRRFLVIIVSVEKKCVTYSECVSVTLTIQDANRMRRIILPSVACLVVAYFFHITSHNQLSEVEIGALTGNTHSFRNRVRKVITSAAK